MSTIAFLEHAQIQVSQISYIILIESNNLQNVIPSIHDCRNQSRTSISFSENYTEGNNFAATCSVLGLTPLIMFILF